MGTPNHRSRAHEIVGALDAYLAARQKLEAFEAACAAAHVDVTGEVAGALRRKGAAVIDLRDHLVDVLAAVLVREGGR